MSKKKNYDKRIESLFQDLQQGATTPLEEPESEESPLSWKWTADLAGRYTSCGEGISDLLGYSAEEVLGKPITNFALSAQSRAKVANLLESGSFPAEASVVLTDAEGRSRLARFHILGKDKDGYYGFVTLQISKASSAPPAGEILPIGEPKQMTTSGALSEMGMPRGILSTGTSIKPAEEPLTPAGRKALLSGQPIYDYGNEGAVAALPLKVMDKTGLLEAVDPNPERRWTEDEQRLAEQVAEQLALALENAQLFQAAQRRAAELESLHQLAVAVSRTLDIKEIFTEALQHLTNLLHIDGGLITQKNPGDEERLQLVAHWNLPKPMVEKINKAEGVPIEGSCCGATFQHNAVVAIEDLLTPPAEFPNVGKLPSANGLRSYLGAPLTYRDQKIGTLCLFRRFPHKASEHEKRLLATIANQVAAAVSNAGLFQQTKEALETTQTLYKATAAFNAASSYEEILQILHKYLGEHARLIAMGLFPKPWTEEDSPPEWVIPASYWTDLDLEKIGIKPEDFQHLAKRKYSLKEYPYIAEVRSGRFISRIENWEQASPEIIYIYSQMLKAKATAFLPLYISGEWFGLINIIYDEYIEFTEAKKQFIKALVNQASIAIQNIRSLENVQKQSQETAALYQATAKFNAATTYNDIVLTLRDVITPKASVIVLNLFDKPWVRGKEKPQTITPVAYWSEFQLPDTILKSIARPYPLAAFPAIQKISPEKPFFTPDTSAEDIPWSENAKKIYFGILKAKAAVALPLETGGRWIGIIDILYDHPTEFDEETVQRIKALASQASVAVENIRAIESIKRHSEETEALYKIASAFNAATSYEEIINILRTQTSLGEGAVNISFNLYNRPWINPEDAPEWVEVKARWSKLPPSAVLPRYPFRKFKTGRLLYNTEPLIITDLENDPRIDELSRKLYAEQFKAKSTIFFPLRVAGKRIGYINAIYAEWKEFTEDEIRFLRTAVAQAAVAFQSLHRYETAQRYAEELETASITASEIAAASQDLEKLLTTAVELIRERFGFYHASVFLMDEQGEYAVVRASTGEAGREMLRRGHRLGVGSKSTVGQAAARREPVVLNDVENSDLYYPNPLLPETRAEAAIPLIAGERLVGILDVQSTKPGAFPQETVRMLKLMATQLAIAVENAEAYALERQALEELQRVDELKSQFLANMSHELRTPLNSIIGFSRVILKGIDGPITDLQREDLTAIYNAGQHLLGLINDILDLSKIEAGKMELAFEDVDIGDLVNSVMSTAVGLVKDKPVKLLKEIEPDLPIIQADPIRVRQVLLNLISNAAKFTEQGHIKVTARRHIGTHGLEEILISVEDTGPGISPEDQKKLFKRFSQVDASLTRKTGGTGLGLSISRNLVEMHGGRIWVESEVGKGTTFYFTLPIIRAETKNVPAVVAIEDNFKAISLYQQHLTPRGYRVVAVEDPGMAIARVQEMKPIISILNLLMPNNEGWKLLVGLKTKPETSEIPLVATATDEEIEKGILLGLIEYIPQPAPESTIMSALKRISQQREIQKALILGDETGYEFHLSDLLKGMNVSDVRIVAECPELPKMLTQHLPDAVFVDMNIPKEGCTESLSAMQKIAIEQRPILVLRAPTSSSLSNKFIGAVHNLLKHHSTSTEQLLKDLQVLVNKFTESVVTTKPK